MEEGRSLSTELTSSLLREKSVRTLGGESGGRQMQTGIERRGDCGRRWWEDEEKGEKERRCCREWAPEKRMCTWKPVGTLEDGKAGKKKVSKTV